MKEKLITFEVSHPHALITDWSNKHGDRTEKDLKVINTKFAKGFINVASDGDKMISMINNIQYKVKTGFIFKINKRKGNWISLMFNSQSCLLFLNTPQFEKSSINQNGSVIQFDKKQIKWLPRYGSNYFNKTIFVYISVKWLETIGINLIGSSSTRGAIPDENIVKHIPLKSSVLHMQEEIFKMSENEEDSLLRMEKLKNYLWALSYDTLLQYISSIKTLAFPKSNDTVEYQENNILDIKERMLTDFSRENRGIYYWAREAGMNRTKFQKIFKKVSNISFYKFYQEARFNEALRLLKFEDYTTSSVAVAIGYKNVGFFIKEFQKRFGMTPNECRLKSSEN